MPTPLLHGSDLHSDRHGARTVRRMGWIAARQPLSMVRNVGRLSDRWHDGTVGRRLDLPAWIPYLRTLRGFDQRVRLAVPIYLPDRMADRACSVIPVDLQEE